MALRRAVARLAGGRLRVGGHADRPSPRLRLRAVHGPRLRRPRGRAARRWAGGWTAGCWTAPTCQAFRDIRGLAEDAVNEAIEAAGERAVVADLAAGPSPYLLHALKRHPGASAILCDIDEAALQQASAAARELGVQDRVKTRRLSAFDRAAVEVLLPRVDVVCELGLYGIYHDDALIERHFLDLADAAAPGQIVCNVQVANPEIEYIARVWRNAKGERCVWRLRPQEQIEGYARAAGYDTASVTADRNGIYRVIRFVRRDGAPERAAA